MFPVAGAATTPPIYPTGSATPSPAYSGTFIPVLWSTKLIEKFYASTVLAAISNTDYEGEIKNKGDKVIIRTKPTITIKDYRADGLLEVERVQLALQLRPAAFFTVEAHRGLPDALDALERLLADLLADHLAEQAAEQPPVFAELYLLLFHGVSVSSDHG